MLIENRTIMISHRLAHLTVANCVYRTWFTGGLGIPVDKENEIEYQACIIMTRCSSARLHVFGSSLGLSKW